MKVCVVILVLYLMTSEQALVKASSSESSSDIDNKVTEAEFLLEIATGYWLGIYAGTFGNTRTIEKLKIRWTQSGSDIRRDVSFLGSGNTCSNSSFDFLVTETGGEVKLIQVGGNELDSIYSQDLGKYYWLLLCFELSTNGEDCINGILNLHIRDTRDVENVGEINLADLPWGKVAADLEDISNVSFGGTNGPKYTWLGTECPLPPE